MRPPTWDTELTSATGCLNLGQTLYKRHLWDLALSLHTHWLSDWSSHPPSMAGGYYYPFYRWEDWGLERLTELLNITQLIAVVVAVGGEAWLWEPKVVLLQSPLPLSYTMMPPIMQWGFQWETEFFSFFYSESRSLLFFLRGREKKRTDSATGKTILAICIHTSCLHFP